MPDLWMPGAERHDVGDHALCDSAYPPKAIAHITWDKNATASAPVDHISFESLVTYFTGSGAGSAPHVIWDPFTGQIAQLFPADSRSKSLVDAPGGTRTNRAGAVVIQIEAVFFPYTRWGGTVYPRLVDTPCKGWPELHAWIHSWGVPDTWPMGRPVDFTPHRDESVWETRGGWYAHAHVPENDHQDPGSWPAFTQEADMPLTDADAKKVWAYSNGDKPDVHQTVANAASSAAAAATAVAAVDKKVDALAATVAQRQTTGLTAEQITAIANAVSDVLAKRLES